MGSKEIGNTACQICAVPLLSLMILPVLLTMARVHHKCPSPCHAVEFSLGPVVSGEHAHHITCLFFLFRMSSELLKDARQQFQEIKSFIQNLAQHGTDIFLKLALKYLSPILERKISKDRRGYQSANPGEACDKEGIISAFCKSIFQDTAIISI